MMVSQAVGKICNGCVTSCFKATCKRGFLNDESYPLEKYGTDDHCPLENMDMSVPNKERLTLKDTWRICCQCPYINIEGNTMSISEENFTKHCMDCEVSHIRENMEVSLADADIF